MSDSPDEYDWGERSRVSAGVRRVPAKSPVSKGLWDGEARSRVGRSAALRMVGLRF